jgi:hypothetical protein
MPARGLRAALLLFSSVSVAACSLSVSFEGSRYKCDPPDGECPPGSTCQADGFCSTGDTVDADVPDADLTQPDAPPDADVPPTAVTVTFGERPTSDVQGVTSETEIDSDNPTGNYGGSAEFYAGRHPTQNQIWVALLRFDLGAIPPGAQVQSASLELWTGNDPLDNGTIQWHRLNEAWTEGTGAATGPTGVASYAQRAQGTPWTNMGAAFPGSSDSTIVSELATPGALTGYTFDLPTSLVQAWVSSPASNFGIAGFVSPSVDSDCDFKSHESIQTDHRPELTVTYVP